MVCHQVCGTAYAATSKDNKALIASKVGVRGVVACDQALLFCFSDIYYQLLRLLRYAERVKVA
jgi:hypothetical protein